MSKLRDQQLLDYKAFWTLYDFTSQCVKHVRSNISKLQNWAEGLSPISTSGEKFQVVVCLPQLIYSRGNTLRENNNL